MFRLGLVAFGIAIFTLGMTASGAQAQSNLPPIPRFLEVPATPKADTPPAPLDEIKVEVSPNTAMPRLDTPAPETLHTISEVARLSSEYVNPRYAENSAHADLPGLWERTRTHYGDLIHRTIEDYRTFYCTENILYVGAAVAIAAPIANTHADIGIRNWYQERLGNGQSRGLDETAKTFKAFGDYRYTVPIYAMLSISGVIGSEYPAIARIGEFGDRSLRALAIGAPMVGILQVGLGSDRPFTDDSRWHPFRSSHGASGHAFVGAVPFLTAASMADSYVLKAVLVAGSLGPAWSRIHTDDHYFSQVLLGWSIAYLSVQSVNQTDCHWRIVPCELPNGVGMGVLIQY